MDIIFDSLLVARDQQIRFPRSRKKRIQRKWTARDRNWRFKPYMLQVADLSGHGHVYIIAHPSFRQQFEKDFPQLSPAVFPLVARP